MSDIWPPQCIFCTLLIGYDDFSDCVEIGRYATTRQRLNLEPPDHPYKIHADCWREATEEKRERWARGSKFMRYPDSVEQDLRY